MTTPSETRDSELVARQERLAILRATPFKPIDPRRKAIAYEISSFLGEVPHAVDNGGVERWEAYLPLADTIDRLTSSGEAVAWISDEGLRKLRAGSPTAVDALQDGDARHPLYTHASPREGHVEVPLEPTPEWIAAVDLERHGVGHHQTGCRCGECAITAVLYAARALPHNQGETKP